jgi:tRNA dimethylallyltransferase
MKKHKLISISGPTAVGKTQFAVSLAKRFSCPIISSDSRQFYKEMFIGTAVPDSKEQDGIKHYFIQHKSIHERYSVGDFERDALTILNKLFKKHEVVIMVGGSFLYAKSLTDGLDVFPDIPENLKELWKFNYKTKGILFLKKSLKQLDPEYYKVVDTENHVRLLRALNICTVSGKPYSSFLNQTKKERNFDKISIEITIAREKLYSKINKRVNLMIKKGLIDEATSLYEYRNLNSLQTVGYREIFRHIDGKITIDQAIESIKKNTRRYAKRQLTWLRNNQCMYQIDSGTEINNDLIFQLGFEV